MPGYRNTVFISKSTILDVIKTPSTDPKVVLIVFNDFVENISDSRLGCDLRVNLKGYQPHLHERRKWIPKIGGVPSQGAGLDQIYNAMNTEGGFVAVEHPNYDGIPYRSTNLKIEVGTLSFNSWPDDPDDPPLLPDP